MTIIAVKKEDDKIFIAYDSKVTRDNEKIDASISLDKVIKFELFLRFLLERLKVK